MGNTVPNKTSKLSYLYESSSDIITQSIYSSVSKAECNIQLFQKQNITLTDVTLTNCSLNINQYANVLCNLVAFFDQNFNNPTDAQGTKIRGFVSDAVDKFTNSTDPVIQNFVDVITKRNRDRSINMNANSYIKNTINQNINVQDFKSCSSNIFVVQDQNIVINQSACKNGKIDIDQTAVIQDYTKCIMGGIINALAVEPSFRDVMRTFNNDISGAPDQVFGEIPDVCISKSVSAIEDEARVDPNIQIIANALGLVTMAIFIGLIMALIIIIIRL